MADLRAIENIEELNEEPQNATDNSPELTEEEQKIWEHVDKRKLEMQEYRKTLGIEDEWRAADNEFLPSSSSRGDSIAERYFINDGEEGQHSASVLKDRTEGSLDWKHDSSDPTLFTKIQTAISILVEKNPEGVFTALSSRYQDTTALAGALWKRNWNLTGAKHQYKLMILDQFKYGWMVGRVYPKVVKYTKSVLTEEDSEDPSKNVYESREIVKFNDVARERMNPYRTWIDESTKPYEPESMKDTYFEVDFSRDEVELLFSQHKNWERIKNKTGLQVKEENPSNDTAAEESAQVRTDIVTLGFYESWIKDLYVITVPGARDILYFSPHPNDDGRLSIFHSICVLRSSDSPYGVGLWPLIKADKKTYDKMSNMTMDQLVLSIYKMFFYTGTSSLLEDGEIEIQPGKGHQLINGKVDFLDIPGPGEDSWKGLQWLKSKMDDNSGITPTLEGDVTGKTLGETLHAKEAALKRLGTPLDNLAYMIEQDAYISLSWMMQIYAAPEIKKFATQDAITAYENEVGREAANIYENQNAETGETMDFEAMFYPEMSLPLERKDGKLFESKKDKFFQLGLDIPIEDLNWAGIIKVIPRSVLSPSFELEKQRKNQVYNIVTPMLASMRPDLYAKPMRQVLVVNEEDPNDWLPDDWLDYLRQDSSKRNQPLIVPTPEAEAAMAAEAEAGGAGGKVPSNQTTMRGAANQVMPSNPTVIPQKEIMGNSQIPGVTSAVRDDFTAF